MLAKTRGIVLSYIKYGETSIICKIYTEEFGLKSFIVNGVRSKSSRMKIGIFQPLTLVDLVAYYKENSSLLRISEIKCFFPYKSIPFEIKKSTIALFLSEVLNKSLKEEISQKDLFQFLTSALISLDNADNSYHNFHLQFLVLYSYFLGFSPSSLQDLLGEQHDLINAPEKIFLEKLINSTSFGIVEGTNEIRRTALQILLTFYQYHVENFGVLNSEKILKEVLK